MATGLYGSVLFYAVDGIGAEVDGVSIADVGLPALADSADESKPALRMVDGETSTPRGLYFIADDAQHRGNVVETAGVLSSPPFGD